jgi:hypothetical protein
MNIRQRFEELLEIYEELKREVKHRDPHEFERWKAGGFLVDDNIMSMYPHLGQVVDKLDVEDEDEELDDEEE